MKVRPASSSARANVGVLGQEAVAGVDRLGAASFAASMIFAMLR